MSEPIEATEAYVYEECDICKHSPAYHDGQGGRPCRAWAPDDSADQTTDNFCSCPGWKDKPKPAPTPAPEVL